MVRVSGLSRCIGSCPVGNGDSKQDPDGCIAARGNRCEVAPAVYNRNERRYTEVVSLEPHSLRPGWPTRLVLRLRPGVFWLRPRVSNEHTRRTPDKEKGHQIQRT